VSSPDWQADVPYAGPPQWGPPQPQWGPPPQEWTPQQWAPPQWAPQQWAPQQWASQQWAPPQYPPPGSGWAPYPPQPPRDRRPGPVIAAAVLVFASAVLVLVGTVYALAFSALLSLARGPDAGMGAGLALLQLALAGLLVAGGLRALSRDLRWLRGAAAGQLALSGWWLLVLGNALPATVSDTVLVLPLLYGALAAVALGLTFVPDARTWAVRRPGG
jgi:hypothetical protein